MFVWRGSSNTSYFGVEQLYVKDVKDTCVCVCVCVCGGCMQVKDLCVCVCFFMGGAVMVFE